MASSHRSARNSQKSLFPQEEPTNPGPERSPTARAEFRRVLVSSGRQKGVGIHVFGVSSGETRISAAIADTVRGDVGHASLDVDDVLEALKYLRSEMGEKPIADFLSWLADELGYRVEKVDPLPLEERLRIQEELAAEDAKLLAAMERHARRRLESTAAMRREYERLKDGSR